LIINILIIEKKTSIPTHIIKYQIQIMQLRSRTITVSEPMTVSITYTTKKENEIKKENENREYPGVIDFINKLKKEFYNFADSSCLKKHK